MPHFDPFPQFAPEDIARQLGSLLEFDGRGLDIRETMAVWRLGRSSTLAPEKPLASLAKDTGRWHHQIHWGRRPVGYVRSRPLGTSLANWTVVQSSVASTLPGIVHRGMRWIDRNVTVDFVTRLLVIPSFRIHAFWLGGVGGDYLLVIDHPVGYPGLAYETLHPSGEFLRRLATLPPVLSVPRRPR